MLLSQLNKPKMLAISLQFWTRITLNVLLAPSGGNYGSDQTCEIKSDMFSVSSEIKIQKKTNVDLPLFALTHKGWNNV